MDFPAHELRAQEEGGESPSPKGARKQFCYKGHPNYGLLILKKTNRASSPHIPALPKVAC